MRALAALRRWFPRVLVLLALAAVTGAGVAGAQDDGTDGTGRETASRDLAKPGSGASEAEGLTPFERRDVREVCERIVCYCGCPHLQVSKCFCGTADAIRDDVAAQLDAGMTPDEIVAAYVEEHGTYGLAAPPKEGFNWVVWAGPFVLLAAGLVAVVLLGRRFRRPLATVPSSVLDREDERRHRDALAQALRAADEQ